MVTYALGKAANRRPCGMLNSSNDKTAIMKQSRPDQAIFSRNL